MADIGAPRLHRRPQRGLGLHRRQHMGADIAEGALVGIEVEPGHDRTGRMSGQHRTQRGAQRGAHLPHPVVLVHDGPQERRLVVHLLEQEDLVVVAVVGGHPGEAPGGGRRIPLVEVDLRVEALRGQAGVGEAPQQVRQFLQALRVGEAQHQLKHPGEVALGIVVAVVDLQAREPGHRMVGPFLDVGEEGHALAPHHGRDELGHGFVHEGEHGGLGMEQEPPRLRARDEEHPVAQSAPAVHVVARRPEMIREEHHPHPGLLGGGKHLLGRTPGMRGVAGMRMEDAPQVEQPIHPRQQVPTAGRQRIHRGLHRRQALGLEAPVGRVPGFVERRGGLEGLDGRHADHQRHQGEAQPQAVRQGSTTGPAHGCAASSRRRYSWRA